MKKILVRRKMTGDGGYFVCLNDDSTVIAEGQTKKLALAELVWTQATKLGFILDIEDEGNGPSYAKIEKLPQSKSPKNLLVNSIGFSLRARNAISRANNPNPGEWRRMRLSAEKEAKLKLKDVAKLTKTELLAVHNSGETTINEIQMVLHHYGLKLQG